MASSAPTPASGWPAPPKSVWGHPLARLLGKRDPVSVDLDRAIEAAARQGVALEINCQPDRLDLPDALVHSARERGVRCARRLRRGSPFVDLRRSRAVISWFLRA